MHDDLKRRLRDEVDAELGTRPPRDLSDVLTRGRGKRLALRLVTTMSMVLVATALVAGGLWIGRTISSPSEDGRRSIQPADDEASPSEQTRCETPELDSADHAGPRCLFDGEVGFHITAGWAENFESRMISQAMGPESLLLHEGPWAGFLVIVDPAPLRSCSRTGATVASAEVFVDAVRTHPGLSSTDPVTEQIAGVNALRLDVTPVEGARTCRRGVGAIIDDRPPMVGVPAITGTHETYFGPSLPRVVEPDQRMRLYLVDLPEGPAQTLAIVIVAAEEDFDVAVEAARPMLDSFEFHGPQQGTD